MGMVSVQAFYLPWCLVALNVAMGGPPAPDLLVRPRRRARSRPGAAAPGGIRARWLTARRVDAFRSVLPPAGDRRGPRLLLLRRALSASPRREHRHHAAVHVRPARARDPRGPGIVRRAPGLTISRPALARAQQTRGRRAGRREPPAAGARADRGGAAGAGEPAEREQGLPGPGQAAGRLSAGTCRPSFSSVL